MKNGKIEQFLDTGWFSEATLYLNGYTYWCGLLVAATMDTKIDLVANFYCFI